MAASADQIFGEIQALPVRDRLQLVERVIRALQRSVGDPPSQTSSASSLLGFLADTPDLADEINRLAQEDRRTRGWRVAGA